ncbi:MAG: hypothetical protein KDJ35_00430 [Alphaproteobacteria bacterium]|nr:hypothetical protein [Alphaproteobacteria bacterium]
MSAIRQALIKLDSAVGRLESSTNGLEASVEARQQDMFNGANGGVNPAIVAQKLDSAIQKVEQVLKETA